MKRAITLFLLIVFSMTLTNCGKKVVKRDFGPDEYFEFAKKKFDDGDYYDAVTEFTVMTLRFSTDPVIDDAQYYLAESHFKQKDYLIAISEYQKLINDYPQSSYAILAQFKIGLSYYNQSLRPELDQDYTNRAIRSFQNFTEEHPDHELNAKCEELIGKMRAKLAKKLITNADTYRKMGEYEAAIIYYDLFMEKYYDSDKVAHALYNKSETHYKLKQYSDALTSFTIFVEKYPEHSNANKAKKRIGKLSDLVNVESADNAEKNNSN